MTQDTVAKRKPGFLAEERGSFTVLNLFLMLSLMMCAGIAIDAVRYESQRTRLQNTLDRAILAAADMNQSMTPQEVVNEYFAKAGMGAYTPTVPTPTNNNVRKVSATAQSPVSTFFMKLLGIKTLTPVAKGTAEESISDVEISLVLDVSSSMDEEIVITTYTQSPYNSKKYIKNTYYTGKTKIESLRDAAKEFVDTVYASTQNGRTSMSMVPYASEVNVGKELLAQYNVPGKKSWNNCVDFDAEDYSTTILTQSQPLHQTDYLDPWTRTMPPELTVCPTEAKNKIIPLSDSPTVLKTAIGALTAAGNTSIDVGLKWGFTLLDPSAQAPVAALAVPLVGIIPSAFVGRPYAYGSKQTMKVLVVMTDGHNTDQYELKENYRAADMSDVWRYEDPVTKKVTWSINDPEGSNKDYDGDSRYNESYFIVFGDQANQSCANSGGTAHTCSAKDKWMDAAYGGVGAKRLNWAEVFYYMSVPYHAYYMRYVQKYDSNDYYWWVDAPVSPRVTGSYKDGRMDQICKRAKDQGVVVFAIGFQVDSTDSNKLEKCASSPAHYYDVQGLEITTAFQSIANAIGKLRLTQ